MKRTKLIAVLAGAIALAGVGSAGFVVAQTFNNVQQSFSNHKQARFKVQPSLSSNNKQIEFKMNELTPAEEAREWQEMKQRFIKAGIKLTPQQEAKIRQAQRQLSADLRPIFQNNPLMTFGQLITASTLPQQQGEALMRTTGLDQRLGIPLLAYRKSVLSALTPEQRPIWEQRIWQRQGEQPQATNNQFKLNPPSPAQQAQDWQQIKQRFRVAGVPLTPQQETQMQAAYAKLQASLDKEFQANPTGTFARFVALAMVPNPVFVQGSLGQALTTHLRSVNQILTPAQRQVWQQGFSNQN